MKTCQKCVARPYCSTQCRTLDWEENEHKLFCGHTGEMDVDFEISSSPDKGLGMFALRTFHKGQKILVDKHILTKRGTVPPTAQWIVARMTPCEGTLVQKMDKNAFGEELFPLVSLINHECIGSCVFVALAKDDFTRPCMLVASRDIFTGDEITISYLPLMWTDVFHTRQSELQIGWGFSCKCRVCTDEKLFEIVSEIDKLQNSLEIKRPISPDVISELFLNGRRLIELYDRLDMAFNYYANTYWNLFKLAIATPQTFGMAKEFGDQCYKYLLLSSGDILKDNFYLVRSKQVYLNDPSLHPWYFLKDPS